MRTENVQEDEFVNGHAHCRQLLTGQSSITLPVVEGEVLLGQWQKIMFVELDPGQGPPRLRPRPRSLISEPPIRDTGYWVLPLKWKTLIYLLPVCHHPY